MHYKNTITITITFLGKTLYSHIASPQAPVVQKVDDAIYRINRYPVDKCLQNQLRYPLDSDLFGE